MSGTHSIQTGSTRTERGHVSVREVRRAVVLMTAAVTILLMALLMKDASEVVHSLGLGSTVSAALVVGIDVVAAAVILSVPQAARKLIVPRRRRV